MEPGETADNSFGFPDDYGRNAGSMRVPIDDDDAVQSTSNRSGKDSEVELAGVNSYHYAFRPSLILPDDSNHSIRSTDDTRSPEMLRGMDTPVPRVGTLRVPTRDSLFMGENRPYRSPPEYGYRTMIHPDQVKLPGALEGSLANEERSSFEPETGNYYSITPGYMQNQYLPPVANQHYNVRDGRTLEDYSYSINNGFHGAPYATTSPTNVAGRGAQDEARFADGPIYYEESIEPFPKLEYPPLSQRRETGRQRKPMYLSRRQFVSNATPYNDSVWPPSDSRDMRFRTCIRPCVNLHAMQVPVICEPPQPVPVPCRYTSDRRLRNPKLVCTIGSRHNTLAVPRLCRRKLRRRAKRSKEKLSKCSQTNETGLSEPPHDTCPWDRVVHTTQYERYAVDSPEMSYVCDQPTVPPCIVVEPRRSTCRRIQICNDPQYSRSTGRVFVEQSSDSIVITNSDLSACHSIQTCQVPQYLVSTCEVFEDESFDSIIVADSVTTSDHRVQTYSAPLSTCQVVEDESYDSVIVTESDGSLSHESTTCTSASSTCHVFEDESFDSVVDDDQRTKYTDSCRNFSKTVITQPFSKRRRKMAKRQRRCDKLLRRTTPLIWVRHKSRYCAPSKVYTYSHRDLAS